MIHSPLWILFPNDRTKYFEDFRVEEVPVELRFQYALHYGFALNPDDEVRRRESALLTATVEQLFDLIDGTVDEANDSVFKITVRHHAATPEVMLACQALLEGHLKRISKM